MNEPLTTGDIHRIREDLARLNHHAQAFAGLDAEWPHGNTTDTATRLKASLCARWEPDLIALAHDADQLAASIRCGLTRLGAPATNPPLARGTTGIGKGSALWGLIHRTATGRKATP